MSLAEVATRISLIPGSIEISAQRKKRVEQWPNHPPTPYTEFSFIELRLRALFGIKVGDVVKTNTISACVITAVNKDGTMNVHSAYWDNMRGDWTLRKSITLQEITALLGNNFDVEKAKLLVIPYSDY